MAATAPERAVAQQVTAESHSGPVGYPLLALEILSGPYRRVVQPLVDGLAIGRSPDRARLALPVSQVSGLHARVERNGGMPVLVDASSVYDTFVNGDRNSRQPPHPGYYVRVGAAPLRVNVATPPATE